MGSRRRKPRPKLPAPCNDCRPFDGRWMEAVGGGFAPCGCDRGIAIAALKPRRKRSAGPVRPSGPRPYDPAVHGAPDGEE